MSYEDGLCLRFVNFLTYVTRVLGVATAVVLWGIGFDMMYHNHINGAYIIVASILVFFFEITWAVDLFLQVCLRDEPRCILACWSVVMWFEVWKKSLVYWILAAFMIIKPNKLWLTTLAGGMLAVLGTLHLIEGVKQRYKSKEMLLQLNDDHYDRFDEETESMNGDTSNEQESESVSNTDYVVQV